MIISGNLLEVGILNDNGWGVSEAGANDILSSLPGLPLKLCKDRAHACDYKPKTEAGAIIGKVISAQRVKNMIRVAAEVNREEEKHIRQGKYPKNWSIFAGYKDYDPLKMLVGARALSVSLVDFPAYKEAGYSIVPDISQSAAAAIGYELSELDQYYLRQPQQAQKETTAAEGLRRALEKLHQKGSGK
jgi:hypothetical protein